jgi:tetraacyldisaccharide 4'-kinase
LVNAWQTRGLLACVLWPLAQVYVLLLMLRKTAFRLRSDTSLKPLPLSANAMLVIVVGNVVAGGGGKTPVVVAIAIHLQRRGFKVGIVSRGHGRRSDDCVEVVANSPVAAVGDEPLLIHSKTDCPVFVARRRSMAIAALKQKHPATQIVISDDGLQHWAMPRDIEIIVFDERGLGNGWLLPAGPLREKWPRSPLKMLARDPSHSAPITMLLQTSGKTGTVRTDEKHLPSNLTHAKHIREWHSVRRLVDFAIRSDGTRCSIAELRENFEVVTAAPAGQLSASIAIAGIAQPHAFFAMLKEAGILLSANQFLPLPDHFNFQTLPSAVAHARIIICTEKDAVKLWPYRPDAWAIPLHFEPDAGFFSALDLHLARRLHFSFQ